MNRHSHFSRGASAHSGRRLQAGNPTPRWRTVFIALVLALTIGNAGQIPLARAAPAGENVRFYMDVVNPKTTICTGETVTYVVNVHSQFTSAPPGWKENYLPGPSTRAGVKVEASSADKSIVTVKGSASGVTGMEFDGTNSVEFQFTAGKKPGKTNIYFEGAVRGYDIHVGYVSFTVPVRVIACKYKVNVISNWFIVQGTGGSIALVALINGATLTADSEGHYTGSTNVRWIPAIVLPSICVHADTVPDSPAMLTGDLSDSGQLMLQVTFDTAALTEVGSCGPSIINTTNAMSPDPLTLTVPGAGGTWRGTQVLQTPVGEIPGPAVVIVIPVEK